mmetsp:Transcript_57685/g.129389  ORF Transcript_57685/g.129389 Transcript_57685/m.129389 type:complete len:170 (+) Transcript_57685:77-586(+)
MQQWPCLLVLLLQLAFAERPVNRPESSLDVHTEPDLNGTALLDEGGVPFWKKRDYTAEVKVPDTCGDEEAGNKIIVNRDEFLDSFKESPLDCAKYQEQKKSKWQLWKKKVDNQEIVNELHTLCQNYHKRWAKAQAATNEFAKYYEHLLETQKYLKNQLEVIKMKEEMLQ